MEFGTAHDQIEKPKPDMTIGVFVEAIDGVQQKVNSQDLFRNAKQKEWKDVNQEVKRHFERMQSTGI